MDKNFYKIVRGLIHPKLEYYLEKVELKYIASFVITLFLCTQPLLAQTTLVKVWDKTYGGSQFDYLSSVIPTSDGGYLLAGTTEPGVSSDKTEGSRGGQDYWVVKLNADGSKAWDKTYGGSGNDWLAAAIATSDGGYLIGGYSYSGKSSERTEQSRGDADYWVVKLNADGSQDWDKAYGGAAYDELTALTATADGGYLLGGRSLSGISGEKSEASRGGADYWLVKITADGSKVWDKTYGGDGTDWLHALTKTSDGGYVLGGSSSSGVSGEKSEASRGNSDYWVLKLNTDGSKVWDKTYGGSKLDDFRALTITMDGGYLLAGLSESGISGEKTEESRGGEDSWVVKLNADGSKAWDKTYGGSANDWFSAIVATTDGGFLLGGGSGSGAAGDRTEATKGGYDNWVIKLNADGSKAWDKAFGGDGDDWIESIASTSDGGYILAGASDSGISGDKSEPGRGDKDYWVIKANVGTLSAGSPEKNSQYLEVYPNPSIGDVNLAFKDLKGNPGTVQLTICNSTGQAVMQQAIAAHQLQTGVQLSTDGLASGIYFLRLQVAGKEITKKLVLQK
ncbi:T9SS type A sorting domain-containing protein [Pontibacter sp. MBLB2868]|uniref:T9SS type A sorting domain-containing protein n=1 Tax=Pontibacter sp. MBLB2868 TaxID=3451555 RepID=UPI003F74C1B4